MYIANFVFESNATNALNRVYPVGNEFLVADEAFLGEGDCEIDDPLETISVENWKDHGIIGFFYSKRRAIDAARYGK